ncbi:hypothetical protein LCGC14_0551570 [marine sediment metagenome]|uniref:Uncharacterized protein n=1 Tax=marine sediment metagenome TaxID=412755 RepID=A0A0F9UXZ6_9ZZZZ
MKTKWEILAFLACFLILLLVVVLVAVLGDWQIFDENGTYLSTAVFDFWSIGHLLAGMGIFMFIFTIYFIIKNVDKNENAPSALVPPTSKNMLICWLITLGVALLWELIENTLLFALEVKGKLDSIINASTDIIIWSIGGLGAWYLTHLMFVSKDYIHAYYLYTIINLFTFFILFIIFGYMTYEL